MKKFSIIAFSINIIASLISHVTSSAEYMVTVPEAVALPLGFETRLTCEMNIRPDKFQWKFYPTNEPYNPKAYIDLANGTFHLLPETKFTSQGRKSFLNILVDAENITGDYQCLAYYGVCVVASIPWRVTIAKLDYFPRTKDLDVQVTNGNTFSWNCLPPVSNPDPFIAYYKDGLYITPTFTETQSLVLRHVTAKDSGIYSCTVSNTLKTISATPHLNLTVRNYGMEQSPYFIVEPKQMYPVVKGDTVLLECSGVGNPIPKVSWSKVNGNLYSNRVEFSDAGLRISNVTSQDNGVYICNLANVHGSVSRSVSLIYQEEPKVDCKLNTTDIKQNEKLEMECLVTGTPEPITYWFLNGFPATNDSNVRTAKNKIHINPVEKRHAGNLQLFARNIVGTTYGSITLRVIPLVSTDAIVPVPYVPTHKGKTGTTRKPSKHNRLPKLIPPTKPMISRLSDESVVVRWSVPHNTGLKILFFKVQYRELGPANQFDPRNRSRGSRWKTTNADIPPNIKAYDILNLKPDHIYKFRIAAVYSNNDNKLSPTSDRFHLKRLDFDDKNPLPIPLITHTETVNTTAVKVFWKFSRYDNTSINGFYISYMSASTAGDYMKATADGEHTREYVITHLQPDTIYDVKLQSFNSKLASEFSPIMKARTAAAIQTQSTTTTTNLPTSNNEETSFNFYVIIASAIVIIGTVVVSVILMFVCRKWKSKKSDANNKSGFDDHHIHEGNEYFVDQRTITRNNGCGINKISITTNPLADADNKTQNLIRMSCMSTQNNNCAATHQESSSSAPESTVIPRDQKDFRANNQKIRLSGEQLSLGWQKCIVDS